MSRLFSVWVCCLLACSIAFGQSSSGSADTEWRYYGHDPGGMRFSPLQQINNTNVQQLQRAWTYEVAPTPNSGIDAFESTP
jgi:quinoprotein glucose dehydrogenase